MTGLAISFVARRQTSAADPMVAVAVTEVPVFFGVHRCRDVVAVPPMPLEPYSARHLNQTTPVSEGQ